MHFNVVIEYISNAVFGLICHQNSTILVEASGQSIMLCPRCSGLHTGFFCCVLLSFVINKGIIRLSSLTSKIFCVLSITILVCEWLLAQFNIIQSTPESRYITGLLAGCAFGLMAMAYRYLYLYNKKSNNSRPFVIILITLISGLGFSQLTNWNLITLLLLVMVIINLTFFAHSLFMRVYLVLYQNHKI